MKQHFFSNYCAKMKTRKFPIYLILTYELCLLRQSVNLYVQEGVN